MANPNTTIQVTMTATDINGNPQASLVTVQAVVTFPDGSQSTYTMANGDIQNAGSGKYVLTYTTKGQGENQEDWTGTDSANNHAEFHNETPVSF